jgi:hypothetical protein
MLCFLLVHVVMHSALQKCRKDKKGAPVIAPCSMGE